MDVQDDERGGDNTVGSVLDLPPSPFRAASALLLSEDQDEQTGFTIREELEPQASPIVQVTPPCDVNSPPGDLILSQSRPLPLTDVTNALSTAARTAEVPPAAADVSSAQTPPRLSRIVTFPSRPLPLTDVTNDLSTSPPHSPAPPATISGTTTAEDHGRRRRTLTEFGLLHAKEIEEKNAKAERSKLKRESLAKSKGKRTGTKEAAAGTKSDKSKGKK